MVNFQGVVRVSYDGMHVGVQKPQRDLGLRAVEMTAAETGGILSKQI